MSKTPFILIMIAIILAGVNMFLFGKPIIFIVATGVLFVAAGLILLERKKQKSYKTIMELVKNEFDIIILMMGVTLFAMKFLVEEPVRTSLHLLSLSTIFLAIGIRKSKRNKGKNEI